jgi:hypothetical protein
MIDLTSSVAVGAQRDLVINMNCVPCLVFAVLVDGPLLLDRVVFFGQPFCSSLDGAGSSVCSSPILYRGYVFLDCVHLVPLLTFANISYLVWAGPACMVNGFLSDFLDATAPK